MSAPIKKNDPPAAKFSHRLFALFYDGLLTFAVMMFAAMIPTMLATKHLQVEKQSMYSCLLPELLAKPAGAPYSVNNARQALCNSSYLALQVATTLNKNNPLFVIYIFAVFFIYPAWFWTRGGQTLGMRSWKIKLETLDGKPISWPHALLRWVLAILTNSAFGLGFFWMLLDPDKQTLYDKLARTRVIKVTKTYVPDLKK